MIAVTGASGFIGHALCAALDARGIKGRAILRKQSMDASFQFIENVSIGNIGANTEWRKALEGVEVVVHCAAQAHVMGKDDRELEATFQDVNVVAVARLAEQAVEAGVRRLVFLSSIKVNGEQNRSEEPFRESDQPNPQDAYGHSKMEAERVLFEIGQLTGLEIVVVRPPLVYGPGVKGNFLSLMRWVNWGILLPLGAVNNQRSLIGIDNLVDFLLVCVQHHAAANEIFVVSDGEDLSTTELLKRIGAVLNKSSRLIPVPQRWLCWGISWLGKGGVAQRLLGNLQVDIAKAKERLDWGPPVSVEEGLRSIAKWYRQQQ